MVPGVLGGVVGAYIAYPFIYPVILVPIGPLSFVEATFLVVMTIPPYRNPLLSIAIAIALKCVTYMFLCGSRFLNRSAISVGVYRRIDILIGILAYALVLTIPTDLIVLSYVKYRDAVHGTASRVWIPALAILWSFTIWLPAVDFRDWIDWVKMLFHSASIVAIAIWIAITVIQIVFAVGSLYTIRRGMSGPYPIEKLEKRFEAYTRAHPRYFPR